MNLVVSPHAPPLVCIFANNIRHMLNRTDGIQLLKSLEGTFCIRSSKNAQAVTFKITDSEINLRYGVADDAQVIITMDFDNPKAKPSVKGLLRHPKMAMGIGKLLTFPPPAWADSAKRFWAFSESQPDVPESLLIRCTDEDRTLTFGEGTEVVELHGKAAALANLFAGNSVLLMDIVQGSVKAKGSFQHLAGLSHCSQQLMLGAGHG